MSVKKKTKFTAFKFFNDLTVITLIDFNKRKAFKALNNFNVNAKLILHDFKLINFNAFVININ